MDIAQLKEILIQAEENYISAYFKNCLKCITGVDPQRAGSLTGEEAKVFVERVFIFCVFQVGGTPKLSTISRGLLAFREFLELVHENQFGLHCIANFRKAIESLQKPRKHTLEEEINDVEYLTKSLGKGKGKGKGMFPGLGMKNAALFMKMIGLYSDFFNTNVKQDLPVPIDRVVIRMTLDLDIGTKVLKATESEMLQSLNRRFENGSSFAVKDGDIRVMNEIAKRVMEPEDRILYDNLWFIGHFYHGQGPQVVRQNDCKVSPAAKAREWAYLEGVDIPETCPLKPICPVCIE